MYIYFYSQSDLYILFSNNASKYVRTYDISRLMLPISVYELLAMFKWEYLDMKQLQPLPLTHVIYAIRYQVIYLIPSRERVIQ